MYEYEDNFIVRDFTEQELQEQEDKAKSEVEALGIENTNFFYEKLVKITVYLNLCKMQYEDETIRIKYDLYKKEFDTNLKYAQAYRESFSGDNTIKVNKSLASIKLQRG